MPRHIRAVAPACCIAVAAILAAPRLTAQSNAQTPAQSNSQPNAQGPAHTHVTLVPDTAIPENTRVELQLHGGDYEVRPSHSGSIGVTETRDQQNTERATTIHFGLRDHKALLNINPPSGGHSPHVIIELPICADLNLHLTAGELVFTSPPCTHTSINLHAGELIANIGSSSSYSNVHASVTIGEINAPHLGKSKGGFFNSINIDGAGQRTLSAHVGSGEILIHNDAEPPVQ